MPPNVLPFGVGATNPLGQPGAAAFDVVPPPTTMGFFPGTVDYKTGLAPTWDNLTGGAFQESRTQPQQYIDFLNQVFPGTALSGWGRQAAEALQPTLQTGYGLRSTPGQTFTDWLSAGQTPTPQSIRGDVKGLRDIAQQYGTGATVSTGDIERMEMFDTPEDQLAAIMAPLTGLGGAIAPSWRRSFQRTYADPAMAAFRQLLMGEGAADYRKEETDILRPGSFLEFLRRREGGLGAFDPSQYYRGGGTR